MKKLLMTSAIILSLSSPSAWAKECSNITEQDVIASQKQWGDGIVAIGKSKEPQITALNHLDTLYGYDLSEVLFKPTKASKDQFRGTKEEALRDGPKNSDRVLSYYL